MEEPPLFRANKKRKTVQRRDNGVKPDLTSAEPPLEQRRTEHDSGNEINLSSLVKARKLNRSRPVGVQFSRQKHHDDDEVSGALALAKIDPDEERLRDVATRFVGSTGQVVDVDKHMTAYIDTQMAKRHNASGMPIGEPHVTTNLNKESELSKQEQVKSSSDHPSQPQLAEFDLGRDSYEKNLARTEAAIARAQSGLLAPPPEEIKPRRPRKPRVGRDGKPFRPRPCNRPNSEDLARDALVEQMLHEHRIDVYEAGEPGIASRSAGEDDENADEKLAEQFRQEFMDALAERQQRHQAKAASAAKAKGVAQESSGPKLGGSRSARAKMAQMQQEQRQQQTGQQSKAAGG